LIVLNLCDYILDFVSNLVGEEEVECWLNILLDFFF